MKFEINLSAKPIDTTPKAKTLMEKYCDILNASNEILKSDDLHRILYAMKEVCEFRCMNMRRLNAEHQSKLAVLQYRYEQKTLELIAKLEETQRIIAKLDENQQMSEYL